MRVKRPPTTRPKRTYLSPRRAVITPTSLAIQELERRDLLSITVTTLADENDGVGVGGISLRDAIAAAVAGETIDFDASLTSGGPGTMQLAHGGLFINKSVAIVGPGASSLTIDARQTSRVFWVETSGTPIDVSLAAMTLTKGNSLYGEDGGAIFSSRANLTIDDCTITGNITGSFGNGAGIFHEVGDLAITNSRITDNRAGVSGQGGDGAGVYHQTGAMTVVGTTISDNSALGYSGGGIYTRESTTTLVDSIIENNTTRGDGGGVYKYLGNLTIQSSTIRNNSGGSSSDGGGALSIRGNLVVSDSSITGNASGEGGGISNYEGSMTILRSTISGNTANNGHGGGIENDSSGLVSIMEAVLQGNSSAENGGGLWSYGSLTIDATAISGNTASANGGGIDIPGGTLSRSTISSNSAGRNGGGIASAGSFVILSSTISGNTAGSTGGGIYSDAFVLTLAHTTVTANKASAVGASGGGVFTSSPTGLDLDHTIIAGNVRFPENTSDEVRGGFPSSPFPGPVPGPGESTPFDVELRSRFSLIGDNTGTTIVDLGGNLVGTAAAPLDPLLDALADNGGPTWTHEPLLGSLVIGAGDPLAIAGAGSIPAYDQRGAPFGRIAGGRIDIGAFEATVVADGTTDLLVHSVAAPSGALAGQPIMVQWTVENVNPAATPSSWSDAVYLSPEPTLGPNSQFIGVVPHVGVLQPGQSYVGQLTFDIPAIYGEHFVVVQTDPSHQTVDADRSNNVGVSSAPISVGVPELALGIPAAGQFTAAGQRRYYQINLAPAETLLVTLDSAAAGGAVELYVRRDQLPTPWAFDAAGRLPQHSQRVAVQITEPGTYYVLAYSRSGAAATSAYALTATRPGLTLNEASPALVGDKGSVTLTIRGVDLMLATAFRLIGPVGTITPLAHSVVDASTAHVTFDFTDKVAGNYRLEAVGAGNTAALDDAVTVVAGVGPRLTTHLEGASLERAGRIAKDYVVYRNDGDADAIAPLLTLHTPTNTPMGFSPDDLFAGRNLTFLGVNSYGRGVIPPGAEVRVPVYFHVPNGAFDFELYAIQSDDATPIDWTEVESLVSTRFTSAADWLEISARFRQQVGVTQGDYVKMLARNASLVPDPDESRHPVHLVDLEVRRAVASLGNSLAGTLVSADPLQVPVAGRAVVARSLGGWETYVTTSLSDGAFVLERVASGVYEISVDGAVVSQTQSVTVADDAVVSGVVVTLDRGTALSGIVHAAESDLPIPSASVLLTDDEGHSFSTSTDGAGRFTIRLPAGTYSLVAEAPGRASTTAEGIVVGEELVTRNVPLAREGTIRGVVNLAEGGPEEGDLQITAYLDGSNSGASQFTFIRPGPDFRIATLPAGSYDLHILRNGYAGTVVRGVEVAEGGVVDLTPITLGLAATISGRVVSTDPAVSPSYQQIGLLRDGLVFAYAWADQDGNFEFSGIVPGDWTAVALGIWGLMEPVPLSLAAGENRTDVTLMIHSGSSIVGRVTNSLTDVPLARLEVQAQLPNADIVFASTDENGMYRFDRLGAGEYEISLPIRGPGATALVTVSGTDGAETTVNLTAAVEASIHGRVLLGDSSAAFGAVVRLLKDGAAVASMNVMSSGEYGFELAQPGTYSLVAHVAGASYAPLEVQIAPGESISRDFMPGTSTLTVEILGAPLGTKVALAVDLPSGREIAGLGTLSGSGSASFGNLAPGKYTVVAVADGSLGAEAEVTLGEATALSLPLTLQQQNALTGTVTDESGSPVHSAWVTLRSTSGIRTQPTTLTGGDGRFVIDYIAAGVYDLIVYRPDGFAPMVRTGVTIASSMSTSASLSVAATAVTGRVIAERDGESPVPNANVALVDGQGRVVGHVLSERDGTFAIAAVAGTYSIEVSRTGYGTEAVNDIVVVANQGTDVGDIELREYAWPDVEAPEQPEIIEIPPPPGDKSGPNNTHDDDGGNPPPGPTDVPSLYVPVTLWPFPVPNPQGNLPQPENPTPRPDPPPEDSDCPSPCKEIYAKLVAVVERLNEMEGRYNENLEQLKRMLLDYGATALREATDFFNKTLSAMGVKNPLGLISDIYKTLTNLGKAIDTVGHAKSPQDIKAAWKAASAETSALINGLKAANKIKNGNFSPSLTLQSITDSKGKTGVLDQLSQLKSIMDLFESASTGESPFKDSEKLGEELIEAGKDVGAGKRDIESLKEQYDKLLVEYKNCIQGHEDDCTEPPAPSGDPRDKHTGNGINSFDPNDIVGPSGFGPQRFISAQTLLPYTINFENDPNRATAAAQEVFVTHQLDADLDWTTVELGDFGFGSLFATVPPGLQAYQTRLNYHNQDGSPLFVDFSAELTLDTGIATWSFRSVDPNTGALPAGVFDGFLPVDDESGRGEGFVTYLVRSQADLSTATTLDAQASIVFDLNDPLDTNIFTNTIDAGPPTSSVNPLPATSLPTFTVSWSGTDDADGLTGAGIASFDVYVSDNGGPFALWLDDTTDTSADYLGLEGHEYAFYSVATDYLGHVQPTPIAAQAETRVAVPNSPPSVSVSGPVLAVRGQYLSFIYTADDLDAGDAAAGFEFFVDWGDGQTQVVPRTGNNVAQELSHTYTASGTFQIVVTATDQHSAASPEAMHPVSIGNIAQVGGDLLVGGTTGNDSIEFFSRRRGEVMVRMNGSTSGPYQPTGRLIAYGQEGNDTLSALLTGGLTAQLFGDGGDDLLVGSLTGNNLLLGGDGSDRLIAGLLGPSILIGGAGSDKLIGALLGNNLLIGGATAYDRNDAALQAILAEWSSNRTLGARVANLTNGGGLNGDFVLSPGGTVFDDEAPDDLIGGLVDDWYFEFPRDRIIGRQARDRVTR